MPQPSLSSVLGGQIGGGQPGSVQATGILQQLLAMTPQQQRDYLAQFNLTPQQEQAILAQLQQYGQGQQQPATAAPTLGAAPQPAPPTSVGPAPAVAPNAPTGSPLPAPGPAPTTPGEGLPQPGLPPAASAPASALPSGGPGIGVPGTGTSALQSPAQPQTPAATPPGSSGPSPLYAPVRPGQPLSTSLFGDVTGTGVAGMTEDQAWQYATTVLGYDARQAYQDYTRNVQAARSNQNVSRSIRGEEIGPSAAGGRPGLDPNTWLQQTISTAEGTWAPAIDLWANAYSQETGQTMTAAQRQQLIGQLRTADPQVQASIQAEAIALQAGPPPPSSVQQLAIDNATAAVNAAQNAINNSVSPSSAQQAALTAAMNQYQGAVTSYQNSTAYKNWQSEAQNSQSALMNYVGTGGFLNSMFSTFVQTAPNVQAQAQQQSILKAFQAVGMMPTASDYAALAHATPDEVQQAILTRGLPDDPKVPYGVYQATKSYVDPLYQQYFGSLPDHATLMGFMGMNQQQILDHVMSSPSKQLPGATVGRYSQLRGFADSMVGAIGYGVSDQVIAAAHAHLQSQDHPSVGG